MHKIFLQDERSQRLNGWLSNLFLMITQILLAAVFLHQRFSLGLPPQYSNDVGTVLLISFVGYWLFRLYINAVHPVFTFKQILLIYVVVVVVMAVPTFLQTGLPDMSVWWLNLLPLLGGPALILGALWLAGYLGERRMQALLTAYEAGQPEPGGAFTAARNLSARERRTLVVTAAAVGGGVGGGLGGTLGSPLLAAVIAAFTTLLVYLLVLRIRLVREKKDESE